MNLYTYIYIWLNLFGFGWPRAPDVRARFGEAISGLVFLRLAGGRWLFFGPGPWSEALSPESVTKLGGRGPPSWEGSGQVGTAGRERAVGKVQVGVGWERVGRREGAKLMPKISGGQDEVS